MLNSDPEITKAVFIRGERMPLSVAVEMYPSEGYLAYLHTISPEAFVIKAEVDGDPLFYLDGDKASYEPLED